MAFKISKDFRPAYNQRDVLERDFPDLWERANRCMQKLVELQNGVLDLLPKDKTHESWTTYPLCEDGVTKTVFIFYIYLRSLYSFAHKLQKMIDEQSGDLVQKYVEDKDYEDIKKELIKTIEKLEQVPYNTLLNDKEYGLDRLNNLKDTFRDKMDFMVFKNWSFCDIIGTIKYNGISYKGLWESAVSDIDPIKPYVGELLAGEKLIRK